MIENRLGIAQTGAFSRPNPAAPRQQD